MNREVKPYSDPYFAGIGVGVVLLAAYVIAGRGLGASGAFASLAAALTAVVYGSSAAATSPATAPYLTDGIGGALHDWLVLELVGVVIGGLVSAWLAGRTRVAIERGAGIGNNQRIVTAFGGGILMGFGAKLARGCTSGQALTGGALLSVGSWIFIVTCFAAGYAFAPVARRLWR
jgi:uncharacterized protein